jgi:PadR family transcriptional regulator PadR
MDNNILKGTIDLLILCVLRDDDCYAYQLTDLIRAYSEGIIDLPQMALYQPLYRLEEKGLIEVEQRKVQPQKRRIRTYYHLTDSGEAYLDSLIRDYKDVSKGILAIIDKKEH